MCPRTTLVGTEGNILLRASECSGSVQSGHHCVPRRGIRLGLQPDLSGFVFDCKSAIAAIHDNVVA